MNNAFDRYEEASRRAEQFLVEHQITTLPIDPIAIAKDLDIEVHAKPVKAAGASGMLIRVGQAFAIAYATHIESQGFRRFSIGHELGHFLLPGHAEAILDDKGVHESFAGFRSDNVFEKEADSFAAALLMPGGPFSAALRKTEPGLEAIEDLATLCLTSLPATAIRYAQFADYPVAVVVSTGPSIDFCAMSETFKTLKDIEWLKKGQPVPRLSHTRAFNQNKKRVLESERIANVSKLHDWFGAGPDWELLEEVLGLGGYGKTLTVLRPLIPDMEEEDEEEQEFERTLEESWIPRFHK